MLTPETQDTLDALAHAQYGTHDAIEAVDKLLRLGCPMERIDKALDELEARAWQEVGRAERRRHKEAAPYQVPVAHGVVIEDEDGDEAA